MANMPITPITAAEMADINTFFSTICAKLVALSEQSQDRQPLEDLQKQNRELAAHNAYLENALTEMRGRLERIQQLINGGVA
jgi:hypothetical protein